MEKLEINKTKKPIEYDDFKNELKKAIAYMTGKCNINVVEEIINSIELEVEEENIIKDNDENSDDGIICKDEVEDNIQNFEINENIDKEDDYNELDNKIFKMDDLEKELNIINKERDKGLDNIDILNFEDSSDKNLPFKNEVEINESKDKVNKYDINEINEERDYLYLFCLNFDYNYQNIKSIF